MGARQITLISSNPCVRAQLCGGKGCDCHQPSHRNGRCHTTPADMFVVVVVVVVVLGEKG